MGLFSNDTSDDEDDGLAADARSDTVTRDVLTDPKGGMTTHNLGHAPIVDFLEADEQPHFVLLNASKGVRVHEAGEELLVEPSGRRRAFVVATDRRLRYLVGADEVTAFDVKYDRIEAFEARSGRTKNRLLVRTSSLLADFPVSITNLGSDDFDDFRAFLDEQTGGTATDWTSKDAELDELTGADTGVVSELTGADALDEPDSAHDDVDDSTEPSPATDPGPDPGSDPDPEPTDAAADDDGEEPLASATNFADISIAVYEDRIEITRAGSVLRDETDKQFLYDGLNGVEFHEAKGTIRKGYLFLNQYGGDDAGHAREKIYSDDAVNFTKKRNEAFRAVKETIEDQLLAHQSSGRTGDASGGSDRDPAIEKLREQFASGEISRDEYEQRLDVLEES